MKKLPDTNDPAACAAFHTQILHRSEQSMHDMSARLERTRREGARVDAESRTRRTEERAADRIIQEAADRELEREIARYDVRDVEELQVWAERFGYKYGYTDCPLRLMDFC